MLATIARQTPLLRQARLPAFRCSLGRGDRLNRPGGSGEPPLPACLWWHACRVRENCSRHSESIREQARCLYRRDSASAYRQSSLPDAAPDLQLLGPNFRLRQWYDSRLSAGNIGDRFDHPLPTGVAIFIEGPGCATAFPDLHSPVSVIGRNCEYIRDSGRYDHSAQRSN